MSQFPDRATGDHLESGRPLTRIIADILSQSLHERLHHVAAKQMQVHGPLLGIGVPPVAPQDQAPEQGEIRTLLEHREEILLVDRTDALLGQQLPEPVDQPLNHFLSSRRRGHGATYPRRHQAPISARPAISDRRSSDCQLVAMAPIRLGWRRRGAAA